MTFHVETRRSARARVPSHQWEYRLLYAVTFLVMLAPAALSRLLLLRWGDRERGSIIQEARAEADRILPFVFMG
jgi:hypothetical protein